MTPGRLRLRPTEGLWAGVRYTHSFRTLDLGTNTLNRPPPFGSLIDSASFMAREVGIKSIRKVDRPPVLIPFFAFRIMVVCATVMLALAWSWKQRQDRWLFPCGALIFATAFGTLAASVLPYMGPFTITVGQAAAPHSTLAFMFWDAGVVVLPPTLAYTAAVYFIFRGGVTDADGYGGEAHALGHLTTHLPIAAATTGTGKVLQVIVSMVAVVALMRWFLRLRR